MVHGVHALCSQGADMDYAYGGQSHTARGMAGAADAKACSSLSLQAMNADQPCGQAGTPKVSPPRAPTSCTPAGAPPQPRTALVHT